MDQGRLVVEIGVSRASHIIEQALGPHPHVRQCLVGQVEVVLLGHELGVPVRCRWGHHGARRTGIVQKRLNEFGADAQYSLTIVREHDSPILRSATPLPGRTSSPPRRLYYFVSGDLAVVNIAKRTRIARALPAFPARSWRRRPAGGQRVWRWDGRRARERGPLPGQAGQGEGYFLEFALSIGSSR